MDNRLIQIAESYGFVRKVNADLEHYFEHPLGHTLALRTLGDFAIAWSGRTSFYQCRAGAFASRYSMTPVDFGAACLTRVLRERLGDAAEPVAAKHFIAGSGKHGCLYDNVTVHDTLQDAVLALGELFSLGRTRRGHLMRDRYLEFKESGAVGADYCDITECSCANRESHNG